MKCLICDNYATYMGKLYDDRYGYHGYFDIYKCSACGHKFLNAGFSQDELTSLYTDYYPRSNYDVTNYKPAQDALGFIAWLNGVSRSAYSWVPENVRVLDIGCGFGETLAYHKARGCDVYGVEADENIRRVADKFGFNVQVGLFEPDQYEPEFFDYVTLDQVIEHVTDPIETLRGVARVLKQGGVAILSTPNSNGWGARLFGSRWINWHAPYHIQHFSRASMLIAAKKAGLRFEYVRTLTSSEWLHYQWNHALTFPSMGEPSPFWSPKANRVLRDKLIQGVLRLLHRTKFNHILTRVLDVLGIGDNLLYFLRKP
jgi:2-polyprenyl-3-methyl-5-hydroxy-6-metoxy-1,4-benzoquinol methylase